MLLQKLTTKASASVLTMLTLQTALFSLQPSQAIATTISNDEYQIEIDQLNAPPEEVKKLPTPTPQPVNNGNFGIATLPYEFSFTISDLFLDFGELSATNPVTRITSLSVGSPGSGYQVFAYQDHSLLSKKNSVVPDTTCDNGACTEHTASVWENNLTYGFGYRCDAITQAGCLPGFEERNSFKQFSDRGKKEISQPIMQHDSPTKKQDVRLTYKVNVPGTQAREPYSNTITFIAVPNY